MIDWSRAGACVLVAGAVLVLIAIFSLAGSSTASAAPTCSDIEPLDIVVHGQHVVRDYVAGIGDLDWPPSGGVVGENAGDGGAATPGGPGPGFHFQNGFPPGASFCLEQAQSTGDHPVPDPFVEP